MANGSRCNLTRPIKSPAIACIAALLLLVSSSGGQSANEPFDPERGILLRGTVVTMDDAGTVIPHGNVLVRDGKIVAVWQGSRLPHGTTVGQAVEIDLGPGAMIFPGLINLHNHPTYGMLPLWPPPSSHVQVNLGRPLGTEPYANRYQWGTMLGQGSPEFLRIVSNPETLLNSPIGLGLYPEVGKYSEIRALLGGETALQGAPSDPTTDNILARNLDNLNFGRDRIESRVRFISDLTGSELGSLVTRMRMGAVDSWLVHLAEGVRDGERRAGDAISSREEFAALRSKGLLTDVTVIVHGTGLEPEDFVAMRTAQSIRFDGTGDGHGAKLVWSPLSNLLLYGQTTLVYQALQAGLVVSLGTDWAPSGSRNLLDELKIADIAMRDPRLLGRDRDLIPRLRISGRPANERREAEIALDKLLIEMVTTNPSKTLRWTNEVGSIEEGKVADLIVITKPTHPTAPGLPDSPYRNLIDATEKDVRLVLVNGEPLSGDVEVMSTLKPGDYEVITSTAGCFQKAIDVTKPSVPRGTETLASIQQALRDALHAMGGDHPPAEGGPADDTNTFSYLKTHIPGAASLTDAQLRQQLTFFFGLTPNGRLNMERIDLAPLLIEDDDYYFHLLEADVFSGSGLLADSTPPFGLYRSNFNHVQSLGNPFASQEYRERYFEVLPRCVGTTGR